MRRLIPNTWHIRASRRIASSGTRSHQRASTRVRFCRGLAVQPTLWVFSTAGNHLYVCGGPHRLRAMRESVEFQNEVARRYLAYGTEYYGRGGTMQTDLAYTYRTVQGMCYV